MENHHYRYSYADLPGDREWLSLHQAITAFLFRPFRFIIYPERSIIVRISGNDHPELGAPTQGNGKEIENMSVQFNLKDQNGQSVTREQFPGQYVLLSFHPLAWTSVCADQMLSLEHNYSRFEGLNVVPLGLSVDAVPSKKAWAQHLELENLRILSDFWPHGAVAEQLDLFLEGRGTSARANVLLDPTGEIVFSKTYEISKLPDVNELFERIEEAVK